MAFLMPSFDLHTFWLLRHTNFYSYRKCVCPANRSHRAGYQVAYTINDADGKTLMRELAPLESIKDHNPKYLITMDFVPLTSHNGIKQINALEWLLH